MNAVFNVIILHDTIEDTETSEQSLIRQNWELYEE
jgi:hypothetical protein